MISALACAASSGEPDPAAGAWEKCRKQVADRKFANDYDTARSALRVFLLDYPDSAAAGEARKELVAIQEVAEKQVKGIFDNAQRYSGRGKFDLALELYTEIITRAPSPEWVRKAREGIERNDKATEPLYAAIRQKCEALFDEWKFEEAAQAAKASLKPLVGTRWAQPAQRMVTEANGVRDFFAALGEKIEKTKDEPRKTPFKVKDITGWRVRGKIIKADQNCLLCLANGVGREFAWKDLLPRNDNGKQPDRFVKIVELYEMAPPDQLALGILLYRRGYKEPAGGFFRKAEKNDDISEQAAYYLSLMDGNLNRVAYDFSSGLQLMDWRATGGRWRIVKGQLVQESSNGEGELLLTKRKYRSQEVRFFYELTVEECAGLISVDFIKDGKNSFGFAFSPADGYSAFASVDGQTKTTKDANFRLPKGEKLRIRCGVKGDTFALSVGRKKLPRLTVEGISQMEGHFRIRLLDSKARFDNIVVRNAK
jgi:tetratricopeptide (TPR) repeat protein